MICKFNETNEYVLYYHSGRKTLRVFRVSDGVMIANYRSEDFFFFANLEGRFNFKLKTSPIRVPSDLSSLESTTDGNSVVLGMVDGNLTVLTIADPKKVHMKEYLKQLPSRNPVKKEAKKNEE